MGKKSLGFILAENVIADRCLKSGIGANLFNIVGIRKKTNVKDKITFSRNAALKAEGHNFNTQAMRA